MLKGYQNDEMYDDFLNEAFGKTDGTISVAGYDYSVSGILKAVDPITYRCGFADWLDSMVTDGNLFEHSDGDYHDCEEN